MSETQSFQRTQLFELLDGSEREDQGDRKLARRESGG
jgi:hypothetical protein